jgi:hypothetical protein
MVEGDLGQVYAVTVPLRLSSIAVDTTMIQGPAGVAMMVIPAAVGLLRISVAIVLQNSVPIPLTPKVGFRVHSVARLIGFLADLSLAVTLIQNIAVSLEEFLYVSQSEPRAHKKHPR